MGENKERKAKNVGKKRNSNVGNNSGVWDVVFCVVACRAEQEE